MLKSAMAEPYSPKQPKWVSGGWGNWKFQIHATECHLDPKCFGENIYIYIEAPTNITEQVQLTFKVTFIYRKFINLYTNKFILIIRDTIDIYINIYISKII